MINGVKKLEFMFKTLVAHSETINPLYRAPGPQKQGRNWRKKQYYVKKTLILVCVPSLQKQSSIFWV